MASDLARTAKEAFVDDDFELAVDLNTRALELDPANADLYADRAQANIKLNNFTGNGLLLWPFIALVLDLGEHLRPPLNSRTACIKLEEYQTAKAALEAGFSLAPTDSRFTRLIKECDEHIAEVWYDTPTASTGSSNRCLFHLRTWPNSYIVLCSAEEINCLPKQVAHAASPIAAVSSHDGRIGPAKESVPIHDASCHRSVKVSSKPKYRYFLKIEELYQKNANMKFYLRKSKSVSLKLKPSLGHHWNLIKTKKSRRRLMCQWNGNLECTAFSNLQLILYAGFADVKSERPSYPSSKTKVDWDKLEAEVKKEEKDEKLDGDAALNKLFRDIYRDADEDMRRAMMKSFVRQYFSLSSVTTL
ncbi:hypothetical protein B296_00021505 [Ensete ventricosum]|uniref:SGS domain-containing protein n=1 Tax=Ensete ventricosum TaxID=4639 RepID=A0A427AH90_ENSVE|nr:hypothetical protein B296_00021505 [Ensete ventricosum]